MSAELKGAVGELRMAVQITRKDTGITETHELVGFVDQEQLERLRAEGVLPPAPQENQHGSIT